jgi:hypothetical protein
MSALHDRVPGLAGPPAAAGIRLTEIRGHLTFTTTTATAWYRVPEVVWAFRPDPEREALMTAVAEQYAALAGTRIHLRRTTRPFPAGRWVRDLQGNARPLPDVPGTVGWRAHLKAAAARLDVSSHATGHTMLGVTVARRDLAETGRDWLRRITRRGATGDDHDSDAGLLQRVERFDQILAGYGLAARRATSDELAWLLHRSIGLGLMPPATVAGDRDGGDMMAFSENVQRFRTPYASTVRLVNRATDEELHVAVLSVGRMEPLEIPQVHLPWMHLADELPFPVEWSTRADVLGSAAARRLHRQLLTIRNQQRDYAEHNLPEPPHLQRLADRAAEVGDQIETGRPVDSVRVHGWHRLAVMAPTRAECLDRVRTAIRLYQTEARIELVHPKGQPLLAAEFVPGQPPADTGYLRRMPVRLFAAALPQCAATVGDRRGDLIGHSAGAGRRPVFFDPHFATEVRERSGLTVLVADPGGGKSTLLGALGYLATRRGVQVTVLDPSGPLARLCAMPELARYARVVDLTGSGRGTLAPYALIPTPRRCDHPTDKAFADAVAETRAERKDLVIDLVMMLLPAQVARQESTAVVVHDAVRKVPADETSTLDDVVTALRQVGDPAAGNVANLLDDVSDLPLAQLFFGAPDVAVATTDAPLTVITMAGLRLPDMSVEREHWSRGEALALPMLHTAHRLAVRRCYRGDMHRRKLVALDEAHVLSGWSSGRSFLVRLARDSRKWNIAALLASQNPTDVLGLDVQNLVSTVFVGRVADDAQVAADALRLLRVPAGPDYSYHQTLAGLSQADPSATDRLGFREFVMRDVDGRVQKIRIDVSYVHGLLDVLDTTPTGGSR